MKKLFGIFAIVLVAGAAKAEIQPWNAMKDIVQAEMANEELVACDSETEYCPWNDMVLATTAGSYRSGICHPDQEACVIGRPGGVPNWLKRLNRYWERKLGGRAHHGGGVCNHEREACSVGTPAGVPGWLRDLNAWFDRHVGGTPRNPFDDNKGQ